MGSVAIAVVCAWCNRKMTAAATGAPVTHTICPSCLEWSIAHPAEIVRDVPSHYIGDAFRSLKSGV